MALTDHSPRLTVANGLSRERRLQQLEVVAELNKKLRGRAGRVHHPERDRGGHPRRRLAGLRHRDPGPARPRRRQRALQAADGRRADDRADGPGDREPARRHPRSLHRPPDHRRAAGPGRSRSSTPRWCSRRAGSSAPRSRSTPARSGWTRRKRLLSMAVEMGCMFSHRHRRACARPARLAGLRLRTRRGLRRRPRPRHQHLGSATTPGMGGVMSERSEFIRQHSATCVSSAPAAKRGRG